MPAAAVSGRAEDTATLFSSKAMNKDHDSVSSVMEKDSVRAFTHNDLSDYIPSFIYKFATAMVQLATECDQKTASHLATVMNEFESELTIPRLFHKRVSDCVDDVYRETNDNIDQGGGGATAGIN